MHNTFKEPWIIILDGLDKTGKSTLRDILLKKLNKEHDVIDRWLLSDVVYNNIYNRKETTWYDNIIDLISRYQRHLLVYIKPKDLQNIPKLDTETDLIENDYNKARELFSERFDEGVNYLKSKGINIITKENDYQKELEIIADEIIEVLIKLERNII